MAPRRRKPAEPVAERQSQDIDMTPDTVSLAEACARSGISYSMGQRLASAGHPLTEGVRILRYGAPGSDRAVYRVPLVQLERSLGLRDEVAS